MDTQTNVQLTANNFDEWFKSSTLETHEEGVFLILNGCDYENSIEVNTTSNNGWTVDSPVLITSEQVEKLFEKVDDFLRPVTEEEPEHPSVAGGLYTNSITGVWSPR